MAGLDKVVVNVSLPGHLGWRICSRGEECVYFYLSELDGKAICCCEDKPCAGSIAQDEVADLRLVVAAV